jgi:hypothetical protein
MPDCAVVRTRNVKSLAGFLFLRTFLSSSYCKAALLWAVILDSLLAFLLCKLIRVLCTSVSLWSLPRFDFKTKWHVADG